MSELMVGFWAGHRKLLHFAALAVILVGFSMFVLLPVVYIVSFTFLQWNEIYVEVFANPLIGNRHWLDIIRALALSLRLSAATVGFDLLFGIPMAYLLARKKFRGKTILEDLTALPLVVPTSGFGFATLVTWTSISGIGRLVGSKSGVISIGSTIPLLEIPLLIFIVHVALTFPYVVLTLQAKILSVDQVYELASRTLGAPALTTFRRILFPLALPGIFSGAVMAFARSLGETGATLIVAGVNTTASIAIVRWVSELKFAPASFLGSLLVVIAWVLIVPLEIYLGRRGQSPLTRGFRILSRRQRGLLGFERFSSRHLARVKDVAGLAVLVLTVITPVVVVLNSVAASWAADPDTGNTSGSVLYQLFGPANYFRSLMSATLTSFVAATTATFCAVAIAVPCVYLIKRYRFGGALRSILKIPLIVPTSALGLSVLLLWGPRGFGVLGPGIWMIILTHIVFSVPVIVEPAISAYEGSDLLLYEESARTLGGNPFDVAETISLPILKRGIMAGTILAFAHSLGETGATFIVMGRDITVPTLVVNMVEALAIPAAQFASAFLIAIALVLLALFRVISGR